MAELAAFFLRSRFSVKRAGKRRRGVIKRRRGRQYPGEMTMARRRGHHHPRHPEAEAEAHVAKMNWAQNRWPGSARS